MDETTFYLAQLMGPVLLILGISFAINQKFYREWFKRLEKHSACLFCVSLIELTAGIAVVLHHNLWGTLPEVLVSLIGWGMILEGGLILLGTRRYIHAVRKLMYKSVGGVFSVSSVFSIVVGIYLVWLVYFA